VQLQHIKGDITNLRKIPIFIYISIVVLVITLIPMSKNMQQKTLGWDKFIHFSVFGILGFFAQMAISLWSLLYTGILAVLTEVLQKFIPGRFPDVLDFSTNMIGIIIGTSLWELVRRRS
jgi:glycopeptide antibiotics resistance protein